MSNYYLGIMCGTSLDSIDISIVSSTHDKLKVIDFQSYDIDLALKNEINAAKRVIPGDPKQVSNTNTKISNLIVESIKKILKNSKIKTTEVGCIGYAGITLLHQPEKNSSTYLGKPEIISSKLDIPVISDFRQSDINAGGQGAPLTGLFHNYLNEIKNEPMTFLNLGGFANITCPLKNKVIAYDTGPANYLLDIWCREKFDQEYDLNGQLASMGNTNKNLLSSLMDDPYFQKPFPKSTGFECFNRAWLGKHLDKYPTVNNIDILTTLAWLTINTISNELNKQLTTSNLLYISGGGAENDFLVRGIVKLTNKKRIKNIGFGLNEKNLESVAFAWLAICRINNKKITNPGITGAQTTYMPGIIY